MISPHAKEELWQNEDTKAPFLLRLININLCSLRNVIVDPFRVAQRQSYAAMRRVDPQSSVLDAGLASRIIKDRMEQVISMEMKVLLLHIS